MVQCLKGLSLPHYLMLPTIIDAARASRFNFSATYEMLQAKIVEEKISRSECRNRTVRLDD